MNSPTQHFVYLDITVVESAGMTSWQISAILRELQVNVNTRMKALWVGKIFTIVNANARSVKKSG